MSDSQVKLFTGRFSPFGQRVQIALLEKGIPFDLVIIEYHNKPQELLDANPIHKKVPAIIHNGKPVAESLVILEYLEDAWPEQVPLMPRDAYEKSRIRFWTDYIYQCFTNIVYPSLHLKLGDPSKVLAIEADGKMFRTIKEGMNEFSEEGPFFTGEKFGFVDVILAPTCSFLLVLKELSGVVIPGPQELPRLNKWIEAVEVHPGVKATLPSSEATYDHFLDLLKNRAAAAAQAAT